MAILKHGLKTAFIDSFVDRIRTGQTRYYYCLGKVSPWEIDAIPPAESDSESYERFVRDNIITARQVDFIDVGRVARRIDWEFGKAYDMYDDKFTVGVSGA
jgi:hypothetical protein